MCLWVSGLSRISTWSFQSCLLWGLLCSVLAPSLELRLVVSPLVDPRCSWVGPLVSPRSSLAVVCSSGWLTPSVRLTVRPVGHPGWSFRLVGLPRRASRQRAPSADRWPGARRGSPGGCWLLLLLFRSLLTWLSFLLGRRLGGARLCSSGVIVRGGRSGLARCTIRICSVRWSRRVRSRRLAWRA